MNTEGVRKMIDGQEERGRKLNILREISFPFPSAYRLRSSLDKSYVRGKIFVKIETCKNWDGGGR